MSLGLRQRTKLGAVAPIEVMSDASWTWREGGARVEEMTSEDISLLAREEDRSVS